MKYANVTSDTDNVGELANMRLFGCFRAGESARKVSFEKVEAACSEAVGFACVALLSCVLVCIVVLDVRTLRSQQYRVVVAKQRSSHTRRPTHTVLKTCNKRA